MVGLKLGVLVYICVWVRVCVCVCAWMRVCVHVCVCVCVHECYSLWQSAEGNLDKPFDCSRFLFIHSYYSSLLVTKCSCLNKWGNTKQSRGNGCIHQNSKCLTLTTSHIWQQRNMSYLSIHNTHPHTHTCTRARTHKHTHTHAHAHSDDSTPTL